MFDVTISGYDGNRSDRNQWRQGPCWSHGSCTWVQYVPSKALTTQLLSGKRDRACKAKFLSFVAFINPSKSFNEIVVRLTLNSDKFEDVDEIFSMRNNELRTWSYWHLSLPPSGVACYLNALSRYQNEMLNKTNLLSETFPFPCRTCWFVGHKSLSLSCLIEVLFDTPFYAECTNIPAENWKMWRHLTSTLPTPIPRSDPAHGPNPRSGQYMPWV